MDMKNGFSPIARVYILLRIADKESGTILARGINIQILPVKKVIE